MEKVTLIAAEPLSCHVNPSLASGFERDMTQLQAGQGSGKWMGVCHGNYYT